jgi:D-amino-acid dehydrogenase
MRVCVLGAGLLGLSSAYYLKRSGHEVFVLDREPGPGLETSFANGGLLTPSMSEPWNAPGSWRVLLASIGRADAPLRLRVGAVPSLSLWGLGFLRHANASSYRRATRVNIALGAYALSCLKQLREEAQLDYNRGARGSLRVFRDQASVDRQAAYARTLEEFGIAHRVLTRQQLIALEPALASIAAELAGGIHNPGDETGDAHLFCRALAAKLAAMDVAFHYGAAVKCFERSGGVVIAARTSSQRFEADAFVAAAGSWTPGLLGRLGIAVPVRPAKGYSVTLPQPSQAPRLQIPVLDDDFHAAVTPLGDVLRIAGTAEFAGHDLRIDPARIANLMKLFHQVLPEAGVDLAAARPWCGLRPMSSDGVPIIGKTEIANLWLNTGHGHLGWTMCAGSGRLLAQLFNGQKTEIDAAPYALARHSRFKSR